YGWPVIDSSHLHDNAPNATGRRDGGGIGIEVSVPDGLTRSMTVGDLLDSFITFLKSLTVIDVIALLASIGYNIARGIGSLSTSEFLDLLPRVSIAFVRSIKSVAWSDARIEAALKSFVQIRECRIERNVAGEGGGGVYGSVLSGVALSGNTIDNNRASAGAGGGVRLSFGSRGAMVGNLIRNNTQTSAVGLGGGGVALRNVGCVIADGDRASDIRNNAAGSGHGGGICLDVIQEIDFSDDPVHPKHDQIYQAILRERFGFWRARLEIRQAAVAQNNARAGAPAGTGGGVFVRRDHAFNVLNVLVSIDDFAVVVSGNRSTDARSHNFHLIDGNLDVRDASVSSLITNGKLHYSA
ncbi:MAG: right-handed parallel beta-helix repeat-containing protein, partial [Phycisphaerales bacterium]|nr:right-handed parallel beta-helix repeat-containing protein [Phycisphaerales bacterium]